MKKEYLNEATKKIYHYENRQEVKTELEAHIDEKADYFRELGYGDEAAEEKACEAMGDAALIADDLGVLHSAGSPVFLDLALLALLAALHAIGYYALKTYAFEDSGLLSALLGAVIFSVGTVYLHSAFAARRISLLSKLLCLPVIGGTGYVDYRIMCVLSQRSARSFAALLTFLKTREMPSIQSYIDRERIIVILVLVLLPALIAFAVMLGYFLRVRKRKNRLSDNRISRFFHGLALYLALLFLLVGSAFCVKSCFDVKMIRQEYLSAYQTVLKISESCTTPDEVSAALEQTGYPFREEHNSNGDLTELIYTHNLVHLYADLDGDEIREEYEDTLGAAGAAYLPCASVTLECNDIYVSNSYDHLTTDFIFLSEAEEQTFHAYVPSEHNDDENTGFYKGFVPFHLRIDFEPTRFSTCQYTFRYLTGRGIHKRIITRNSLRATEEYFAFYDFSQSLLAALKEQPDITAEELAALTDCEILKYSLDYDEYMERIYEDSFYDFLMATAEDEEEQAYLEEEYTRYMQRLYHTAEQVIEETPLLYHNGYFIEVTQEQPRSVIFMTSNNLLAGSDAAVLAALNVTAENDYENYYAYGVIKKVNTCGGFFDKNGLFYDTAEEVPYYTADGKRYYFYRLTIEDKTHTVGNTYEHYLTDRQAHFVKEGYCFVDQNGTLVIDTKGAIKYDSEEREFKDSFGNVYHKALETSWSKDGEQLFQSDAYETESSSLLKWLEHTE